MNAVSTMTALQGPEARHTPASAGPDFDTAGAQREG